MQISGFIFVNSSKNESSFNVSGCKTFNPFSWAKTLTGGGVDAPFLPVGSSGVVTTASTLKPVSISFCKLGTANFGVPNNIVL